MLKYLKLPTGLLAAAVLILIAGTGHAEIQDENIECSLINEITQNLQGLYKTDGVTGVTVTTFIQYAILSNGKSHVCKIGLRFPHPSRVTHCTPFGCPEGMSHHIDFDLPENVDGLTFKSIGFEIHPQGHALNAGNYKEYREYWNACHLAGTCPGPLQNSFSHDTKHVDIHFFYDSAAVQAALTWVTPDPPSEIQEKCDRALQMPYAIGSSYYSDGDCARKKGVHWSEDKFETKATFLNQPVLKLGTYDGLPNFLMVGATPNVIDWVAANAQNKEATISFPLPEGFFKGGDVTPTHYFMKIVPAWQQIGGLATVEIGLTRFKHANPPPSCAMIGTKNPATGHGWGCRR